MRCLRRRAVATLTGAVLVWTGAAAASADAASLLADPSFCRGVRVYAPAPGRHVKTGVLRPPPAAALPVWGLAQWNSRSDLAGAEAETGPNRGVRFRNAAKRVTFFEGSDDGPDVSLRLNGRHEWGERLRDRNDPWPHLLLEQDLAGHPSISELGGLQFRVTYRLVAAEGTDRDGLSPRLHAAQFLAYLTVQDRNRTSEGFGDYLWFGIPMYDSRHPIPPAHAALDRGTGKFIYNPGGKAYTDVSAHGGDWVTIDCDLLPLVRRAVHAARERGYLKASSAIEDLRLGAFNMGWEVTAPLDVEIALRGLALDAKPRPASKGGAKGEPKGTSKEESEAEPKEPWSPPTFTERQAERDRMVRVIRDAYGLEDKKVLAAMRSVPRHKFVPDNVAARAYDDTPLPIGYGQTISQPYMVAEMTRRLALEPDDHVLEVGTGSGYQAAVLTHVTPNVYTMEIVEPLAKAARKRLKRLGYDPVKVRHGDGYHGWPEGGPFDAIIVTCAAGQIPPPLVKQLKPGGRMIIPVGGRFSVQRLMLVEKDEAGEVTSRSLMAVRFVPLLRQDPTRD